MRTVLQLGAVMALVWTAAPAVAQGDDPNVEACFYESLGERIRACSAMIQSGRLTSSGLAIVFYNRGQEYHLMWNLDRAIADYSDAIRLDPNYALALYARGMAKDRAGQDAESKADIDRALAIDPDIASKF